MIHSVLTPYPINARVFWQVILIALACYPIAVSSEYGPCGSKHFVGDIGTTLRNDSLLLRYDIRTDRLVADSIFLILTPSCSDSGQRLIYRRNEFTSRIADLSAAMKEARSTSITGTETFPICDSEYIACDFIAYGVNPCADQDRIHGCVMIRPPRWGIIFRMDYGYGHFRPEGSMWETNRFLLGIGAGYFRNLSKSRAGIEFNGDFGGSRRNYLDKLKFQLGYMYFTGSRVNYAPAPFGQLEYCTLSAKKDGNWLRKRRQFGVGIGVGFKGRFEELSYSYHSAQEGYHSLELFLLTSSSAEGRVGSVFAVDFNKESTIFKLALKLEAEGWSYGPIVNRYNNRPFWHRALAHMAIIPLLPLLPFAAATRI